VSDNDSEFDEEDEDYVSEHDLEVLGEQSGTVESTGSVSGGTEAPVKKVKIILTEKEEKFAKQFKPASSKIDKE
jgi:hypothetical protein